MNDFETRLAHIGDAVQKRQPMSAAECKDLALGFGLPLALLLVLVAFSAR